MYSICTGNFFLLVSLYFIPIGGSPHNDGSPILMENIRKNHPALLLIYDTISFVGLIFVAVCLVFNIVFRNKKSVTGSCISELDSLTLLPFTEPSNFPVLI